MPALPGVAPMPTASQGRGAAGQGFATAGLTEADVALALQALDACLDPPWKLQKKVSQLFQGRDGLSKAELMQVAPLLIEQLGLPGWLLDNLSEEVDLFDLDGNGVLDEGEAKRMFKKVLLQKRTELGGHSPVDVPFKTLGSAGYTVIKQLGQGGQGSMYLCSQAGRSKQYCVKFYDKQDMNHGGIESLVAEFKVMRDLDSKLCAQTYEVFQDESYFYLVNEPYMGGDLTKLAKRAYDKRVNLSENWWRLIFKQCLEGLDYLHLNAIIHCDIKEPNIMIRRNDDYRRPEVVLIDFGLASAFAEKSAGGGGTPGYIPPETWQCGRWYPRGDIFSMGIVFFQLLSGQVPTAGGTVAGVLQGGQSMEQFAQAAEQQPLPWDLFPSQMRRCGELVEAMTLRDRRQRLTSLQALGHEWFRSRSDSAFPKANLTRLLDAGHGHNAKEQLAGALQNLNLYQLRELKDAFAMAAALGQLDDAKAAKMLQECGIANSRALVQEFSALSAAGHTVNLSTILDEEIEARRRCDQRVLRDAFDELDRDKNGVLDREELRVAIEKTFDVPYDEVGFDHLVEQIDTDGDGFVTFEEFFAAASSFGKVLLQAQAGVRQRPARYANHEGGVQQLDYGAPRRPPGRSPVPQQASFGFGGPGAEQNGGERMPWPYAGDSRASPRREPMPWPSAGEVTSSAPPLAEPVAVVVFISHVQLTGVHRQRGGRAVCTCRHTGTSAGIRTPAASMGMGGVAQFGLEQELQPLEAEEDLEFRLVVDGPHGHDDLGGCRLQFSQYAFFGYDGQVTLSCPRRGITGLLFIHIETSGVQYAPEFAEEPMQTDMLDLGSPLADGWGQLFGFMGGGPDQVTQRDLRPDEHLHPGVDFVDMHDPVDLWGEGSPQMHPLDSRSMPTPRAVSRPEYSPVASRPHLLGGSSSFGSAEKAYLWTAPPPEQPLLGF
eukprot:TRINITY_DN30907_c0_g1_i1.p1 TRINITY_DN30907_c0_g1~~TRINITY_DN30907_c0_g1_i1.p1  ORF type:complete len:940 (+),score=214.68 TRINITY_DN30907_c0_g1_i1:158-2977(+)